ncbi:hypothetical protein HDU76_012551 [Blyttiomyces sp. JEL0837]|nr:hypothetical protein HDU76_012551 [Blyttiomyces sp. JEL0837]
MPGDPHANNNIERTTTTTITIATTVGNAETLKTSSLPYSQSTINRNHQHSRPTSDEMRPPLTHHPQHVVLDPSHSSSITSASLATPSSTSISSALTSTVSYHQHHKPRRVDSESKDSDDPISLSTLLSDVTISLHSTSTATTTLSTATLSSSIATTSTLAFSVFNPPSPQPPPIIPESQPPIPQMLPIPPIPLPIQETNDHQTSYRRHEPPYRPPLRGWSASSPRFRTISLGLDPLSPEPRSLMAFGFVCLVVAMLISTGILVNDGIIASYFVSQRQQRPQRTSAAGGSRARWVNRWGGVRIGGVGGSGAAPAGPAGSGPRRPLRRTNSAGIDERVVVGAGPDGDESIATVGGSSGGNDDTSTLAFAWLLLGWVLGLVRLSGLVRPRRRRRAAGGHASPQSDPAGSTSSSTWIASGAGSTTSAAGGGWIGRMRIGGGRRWRLRMASNPGDDVTSGDGMVNNRPRTRSSSRNRRTGSWHQSDEGAGSYVGSPVLANSRDGELSPVSEGGTAHDELQHHQQHHGRQQYLEVPQHASPAMGPTIHSPSLNENSALLMGWSPRIRGDAVADYHGANSTASMSAVSPRFRGGMPQFPVLGSPASLYDRGGLMIELDENGDDITILPEAAISFAARMGGGHHGEFTGSGDELDDSFDEGESDSDDNGSDDDSDDSDEVDGGVFGLMGAEIGRDDDEDEITGGRGRDDDGENGLGYEEDLDDLEDDGMETDPDDMLALPATQDDVPLILDTSDSPQLLPSDSLLELEDDETGSILSEEDENGEVMDMFDDDFGEMPSPPLGYVPPRGLAHGQEYYDHPVSVVASSVAAASSIATSPRLMPNSSTMSRASSRIMVDGVDNLEQLSGLRQRRQRAISSTRSQASSRGRRLRSDDYFNDSDRNYGYEYEDGLGFDEEGDELPSPTSADDEQPLDTLDAVMMGGRRPQRLSSTRSQDGNAGGAGSSSRRPASAGSGATGGVGSANSPRLRWRRPWSAPRIRLRRLRETVPGTLAAIGAVMLLGMLWILRRRGWALLPRLWQLAGRRWSGEF